MHIRSLTLFLAVLLLGCSGNDDRAGSAGSAPGNASPGGLWHGTDSESGLHILGLIDEAGELRLVREDNLQYVGTANVSGNRVSGTVDSLTNRGTTYPDGSTHGAGNISGSVTERQTLRLSIAFQTDNGTAGSTDMTLDYDQFYETKSSLAGVAGSYAEADVGTVFAVDSAGHFSAQDARSGCSIAGNVSLINPDYNIYKIAYAYSACSGPAVVLNGVTADGMGYFTDAGLGAQVLAAVSYSVSEQRVGLVVDLNRLQ